MQLEQIITNPELPSLPEAVIKLNGLISSDASMNEITHVIEHDPGLSIRTLELANSAWFKREKSIDSIHDAISIIGLTSLYHLIFASSVTRIFARIKPEQMDMRQFWQQSVRTATIAQSLAAHFKNSPQNLFTSGLILYIGQLALITSTPKTARKIFDQYQSLDATLYSVEESVLGYNHSDICAALLERWKMPPSITNPVKFYIHPIDAPGTDKQSSVILYLAHYLNFSNYKNKNGDFEPVDKLSEEILSLSNLDEVKCQKTVESAANLYDEALVLLGL